MTSKFQEILEPTEAPAHTHPHLNVSLQDVLREGRERSSSESSDGSQSGAHSGNDSPKSPTSESKSSAFRRRAFTLGSKKGRRTT